VSVRLKEHDGEDRVVIEEPVETQDAVGGSR
jgi:hypothetical protein